MSSNHDHESVHGHESSPGPDGRIPSSTGWPGITIKTPGPEMHDPRASESGSDEERARARRDAQRVPPPEHDPGGAPESSGS